MDRLEVLKMGYIYILFYILDWIVSYHVYYLSCAWQIAGIFVYVSLMLIHQSIKHCQLINPSSIPVA